MSRKKNKTKLGLGYHVVAFVDLMGQQELLRSLTKLPDEGNEEEYRELVSNLKDTYGAVKTMRESLQKFITSFEKQSIKPEGLPKEKKALFRELTNNPIRVHQFSDFVLAFLSLRSDQGAKLPMRGIYGILGASALTQLVSLASGHPIRGGIDLGVNLDIKHNEIYGASLARAYALESHIANYPRVVVGTELRNYLIQASMQSTNDEISKISSAMANSCLNMLAVDDDGYPFIDFLGEHFKDENEKLGFGNELVVKAYGFVLSSSAKFQEKQSSKLAFKYTLLRNYMESRLHLWGVNT